MQSSLTVDGASLSIEFIHRLKYYRLNKYLGKNPNLSVRREMAVSKVLATQAGELVLESRKKMGVVCCSHITGKVQIRFLGLTGQPV